MAAVVRQRGTLIIGRIADRAEDFPGSIVPHELRMLSSPSDVRQDTVR